MPANIQSPIVRVTTGKLNTVNDAVPGAIVASVTGGQAYQGQLGQKLVLGPDEVRYSSAIGTLYGGVYQYVRFASGATAAPARGLIAFWDLSVAENLYQITNDENGAGGVNVWAGIVLSAVTRGNYGWIQTEGKVYVQFRTLITAAIPAIGDPVYCAGAGAGADVATADIIRSAAPASEALVAQMQQRYLGVAEQLPVNNTITRIQLRPLSLRV